MVKVSQTILSGHESNCFQACVASILEFPIDAVPNFVGLHPLSWYQELVKFLRPMNMSAVYMDVASGMELPGYSIMSVELPTSRKDRLHCVVALDGNMVWDPAGHARLGRIKFGLLFTVLDPCQMISKKFKP
jgi:hypothetical protein